MKIPSYCHHKPSGRAFVKFNGKRVYLGKFGTPESIARYERALSEHLSGHRDRSNVACVVELLAAYFDHAQGYQVKDGRRTTELDIVKTVIRKTRNLYGNLDVIDFRPKHLKALQQAWIRDGLSVAR